MSEVKGETTTPALGVSVELQYAGGRKVVLQTYLDREAPEEEINALLDKVNAVADRAEAYYAQEQAKLQLEVEEKALANMVRRLSDVESAMQSKIATSGKREPRLSGNEEREKKQAYDSVEESNRRVATCKAHLANLIRKAGGRDGTSSAANS